MMSTFPTVNVVFLWDHISTKPMLRNPGATWDHFAPTTIQLCDDSKEGAV